MKADKVFDTIIPEHTEYVQAGLTVQNDYFELVDYMTVMLSDVWSDRQTNFKSTNNTLYVLVFIRRCVADTFELYTTKANKPYNCMKGRCKDVSSQWKV